MQFSLSLFSRWVIGFLFTSSLVLAQGDTQHDSPESAATDPDFAVQGEYAGPAAGLQVIAAGNDNFELVVYAGGLPGAGWDRTPPERFDGDAEAVKLVCQNRKLKRIERVSPTMNVAPPAGSVVLFDGTQKSIDAHWQSGARMTKDGLLMQGATSKDTFQDYTLHIEFRTPFEPKREGQGRGNSGVYHQGRYETQVLDSFGLAGSNNETGGIYSIRDPDLNMCFPPLTWQTYDVDFTAAKFSKDGKKISDARLTVRLNGVIVQNDVAVPRITTAAPVQESAEPGPIYLQDHGNPVRFRNLWVLPRDSAKDARQPIVPAFDRLFADESLSGRALISQLGCIACHANSDPSFAGHMGPVLDNVGTRLRFDSMVAMASAAHQTKVGTAMPDLFHGLSNEKRKENGLAIASYLATTGKLADRPGDTQAIKRGEELYHTIGCIACHAPRRGDSKLDASSVPLGNLTEKYSVDGLAKFLSNPHLVRPQGNMPRLVNTYTEARDLACYLIGDRIIAPGSEQFTVKVYHGSWNKLPEFENLTPVKTGTTLGLDLNIAERKDNFALQFNAYLPISVEGDYKFYIASDDGSRLLIDDQVVVVNDGIHPVVEQSGTKKLSPGVHRIQIDYFENGGGEDLILEMEGPDLGRAPISMMITSDPKGDVKKELIPSTYQPDPKLVAKGKELFTKTGCANCHKLTLDNVAVLSSLKAPALSANKTETGCLSNKVPSGLPEYDLTFQQRSAIAKGLKSLSKPLEAASSLHLNLASKNCYACHSRGPFGGPETARDPLFTSRTPEMGNEGRLPPPLTGVGDKLRPEVIAEIVANGAKDRPYMVTRMPAFGTDESHSFRDMFAEVDRRSDDAPATVDAGDEAKKELLTTGRKLVGSDGLSCVKCHVFNGKGTGIQAIDMAKMSQRLRPEWFARYMLAPTEYRPGTRMPLSFPEGKSTLESIYDGDAKKQINAMWYYLAQGKSARPPSGIDAEAIVLVPDSKPVIYRNFIEGLGPRGIAIGYPEKVNLAWDAGNMNVAMLWKNDFIDASKHWVGRGPGFQGPLGDEVVRTAVSPLIAKLDNKEAAWPKESGRELGFQFQGYRLNDKGQPTFEYRKDDLTVSDFFVPLPGKPSSNGFTRSISIKLGKATKGLVCRLAQGRIEKDAQGNYRIDGQWNIAVQGVATEILKVGEQQELRALLPETGTVTIVETISW